MSFPAPVLPMHRQFIGAIVVAWAHRAALRIAEGREALYAEHEAFFYSGRTYLRDCDDLYLIVNADGATCWRQPHAEPGQPGSPVSCDRARDAAAVRMGTAEPLRGRKPQMPCNLGLFAEGLTADLVDLSRRGRP